MASVASQLIESLHMRKGTVSRMRERYAQTVLTFRITYVNVFIFHTRRCAVHSNHFIAGEASHTI